MEEDAKKQTSAETVKDYNTIFERLVENDKDLRGLVAYGIYKQTKRDWIVRYKDQNNKNPNDQECRAWVNGRVEKDLQLLCEHADNILKNFGENFVEKMKPGIEKTNIEKKIEERTKFWPAVGASFVAWIGSLFIVVLILTISSKEFRGLVVKMFFVASGISS
ncbi:putative Permease [Azospirillaceae bacterium]